MLIALRLKKNLCHQCSPVYDIVIFPAKTECLVRYPTTLAPASGTQSVTTQCADNAHRTSSSLSITCIVLVVSGVVRLLSVSVILDIRQPL